MRNKPTSFEKKGGGGGNRKREPEGPIAPYPARNRTQRRRRMKASRGWRSREARPRPDLATRQCQTVPRHDGGLRRKPRASAAWGRAPSRPVLTPISQPRSTISRQLALDAADVEP